MNAKKTLPLLISLLSFAILSSCFYRIGHDEWMLLTGEEAAMLDLNTMPRKDYYRYANRNLMNARGNCETGPRIEFSQPEVTLSKEGPTVKIQPPAKLVVFFFEGKSGKPVDMSTLKVVGKKWGFSNNLTKRLRPFIVGQKIDAANVEIPSGKFHLEVSIADTSGMKTVANYIFEVH